MRISFAVVGMYDPIYGGADAAEPRDGRIETCKTWDRDVMFRCLSLVVLDKTTDAVWIMYTTWQNKCDLLGPFGDLLK